MKPFAVDVLRATGYLTEDGAPAEGLVVQGTERSSPGDAARLGPLMGESGGLAADAVFRVGTSPVILFKSSDDDEASEIAWHRLAWNFGVAPLLWVTTPRYVRLYNAYQPPKEYGQESPLLEEIPLRGVLSAALERVEGMCGRQHVAMGSFWRSALARRIDRRMRIDSVLLAELGRVLEALVRRGLRPALAQKLVGRCVFFQYLVHRGYIGPDDVHARFGAPTLHAILTDLNHTYALFRWIRTTFNGDLFPIEDESLERSQIGTNASPLEPLADFFGHFNIKDGQGRLFPFRFDAIPVELISSIYEKFLHISETDGSPHRGVHYTPINLVDLVLDPAFEGLAGTTRVLDPACGSGVFLVESLRRLVWMRSHTEPLTRALIRDTLFSQIRGVDISPAALSVAAFSLYLALLELDPSPGRDLDASDWWRFEPLVDKVLFATSAFNPALAARMATADSHRIAPFDLIVGNPPWTYSPEERQEDRALAKRSRQDDAVSSDVQPAADNISEEPERRSGTTYARLNSLPIPARSTDWPFLWRARDFSHSRTRVALIMKATPFLSLDAATRAARDAILRAYANVNLVNLSQLRLSRLFQEYETHDAEDGGKRPAAGPALLFLANCLSTPEGSIGTVNFPWSSSFQRTGVFELPVDPPQIVALDAVQRAPGLLKASFFGTERDAWLIERLARNSRLTRLGDWARACAIPMGQGYQGGEGMPAAHLIGLPTVHARDIRHGRIAEHLKRFTTDRAHRARDEAIYRGPLVLLPEGSLTTAPVRGRYTAAFDRRDLAYNESFVGLSFRKHSEELARAFAALMHSSFVSYQLGLIAGTLGVKQTKVEAVDLENVYIPRLEELPELWPELSRLGETLASDVDRPVLDETLAGIDAIVSAAAGLSTSDILLLSDVERRMRAIFFETDGERVTMESPPSSAEIAVYAASVCAAFNAFAVEHDDVVLSPDRYAHLEDVIVVKLVLGERSFTVGAPQVNRASIDELPRDALSELGGPELPYLKVAKSLRLYVDRSVYMMKPAQYRCFSPAAGLSDGDRVIADLMSPDLSNSEGRPA